MTGAGGRTDAAGRGGVRLRRTLAARVALLALVWLVLTGGDPGFLPMTAVIVGAAACVSLVLVPPGSVRLSARGIIRFIPLFVSHSVHGGFDVARRAIREPHAPNAGVVTYTTSLRGDVPRYFFAAVIGLFPGSLVVEIEGDWLRIHTLDRNDDHAGRLAELERRVAGVFGEDVSGE